MPSTSVPSDQETFSAQYFDGQRAVVHQVTVRLGASALDIYSDTGTFLDQWRYDDVEMGDRSKDWVRVAKRGSEARLTFMDASAFHALLRHAPNMMNRQKRIRRGMMLVVASTFALVIGVYLSIPLLTKAIVAIIPLSVEANMGKNAADAIVEVVDGKFTGGVCSSAKGDFALEELVQTMSKYSSGPFSYNVRVLNVDMANAIALPGGQIFIFKGLLDEANTVEEVAGVLAHEMAHVNFRHPMHGMVHQTGLGVLANLMFGGSSLGEVSSFLMSTSYTREAESEADEAAITVLKNAGISTQGFADFFERLHAKEEEHGIGLPSFLSTHPPSDKRAELASGSLPSSVQILSDDQWQALKNICPD